MKHFTNYGNQQLLKLKTKPLQIMDSKSLQIHSAIQNIESFNQMQTRTLTIPEIPHGKKQENTILHKRRRTNQLRKFTRGKTLHINGQIELSNSSTLNQQLQKHIFSKHQNSAHYGPHFIFATNQLCKFTRAKPRHIKQCIPVYTESAYLKQQPESLIRALIVVEQ